MEKRSVVFIAVKRENMIRSDEEAEYYGFLSRKKIETLFSVADNFGLRFITVSRKGLAVKLFLVCWLSISIS